MGQSPWVTLSLSDSIAPAPSSKPLASCWNSALSERGSSVSYRTSHHGTLTWQVPHLPEAGFRWPCAPPEALSASRVMCLAVAWHSRKASLNQDVRGWKNLTGKGRKRLFQLKRSSICKYMEVGRGERRGGEDASTSGRWDASPLAHS